MYKKVLIVLALVSLMVPSCANAGTGAPSATNTTPEVQPVSPAAVSNTPEAQTGGVTGFGTTLKTVLANGQVRCGTQDVSPAFGYIDSAGKYSGFDIDFCRVVAAAIFGDVSKGVPVVVTGETRFPTLQNGDTDVLIRTTTYTFSRDVELGLSFPMIYFYDGQGIMAPKAKGFKSLEDINGASICMDSGTTTEANIADAMTKAGLTYTPVVYENNDDMFAAYEQGRCDVVTGDRSALISGRAKLKVGTDHEILAISISKEPFSPVVRQGDDQWADIVRWSFYVPIIAEEHGITSANVDEVLKTTKDPEVMRLLGLEGDLGSKLGLSKDYAYNIIKLVGNYGEIYNASFGENTATAMTRGFNNLWSQGGLIYAPPYR
jgi:general L-amino acid transport system substrate-binding protein